MDVLSLVEQGLQITNYFVFTFPPPLNFMQSCVSTLFSAKD
jgi:hypothetical protein